jgi:hypothetical protein
LEGFYDLLKTAVDRRGFADKPELWWNFYEAGFSYVIKPTKAVTPNGTKGA